MSNQYVHFKELRNAVLKALEAKRAEKIIGKSIDASLLLHVKDEVIKDIVNNMDAQTLQHVFIVSKVTLKECECELDDYTVASLKVVENNGVICERCWNRIDEELVKEGNLCQRCFDVINNK